MEKPRILIVDDDDELRSQMRWALNSKYDVLMAEDRNSALDVVRKERPGVVTLDLGLPPGSKEYSEETAREIDQEVKQLIDASYKKVQEMLKVNQDKLKLLAAVLLQKETVEGDDIRKILGLPEKKVEG